VIVAHTTHTHTHTHIYIYGTYGSTQDANSTGQFEDFVNAIPNANQVDTESKYQLICNLITYNNY